MTDPVIAGETLTPVWAWLWSDYLLSAGSPSVAEDGIGYVTVALITWDDNHTVMTLTHVATVTSLPAAVQCAKAHRAERAA